MSESGKVYLVHLDTPYKHARHYLGYTSRSMKARMNDHATGKGSRLLDAATKAGIGWSLVRYWSGDRQTELKFKQRHEKSVHRAGAAHGLSRYCPVCQPEKQFKDGKTCNKRVTQSQEA